MVLRGRYGGSERSLGAKESVTEVRWEVVGTWQRLGKGAGLERWSYMGVLGAMRCVTRREERNSG